ncbi:ArsR/SmtB family transcription factor [Nonomuraea ferruginea]
MRQPDPERQAVAVFAALTDPTRRALLEELARAGPATVTDLARRLPISRQAIAKHLGQLAEAGLISPGEPARPSPSLPAGISPPFARRRFGWPCSPTGGTTG